MRLFVTRLADDVSFYRSEPLRLGGVEVRTANLDVAAEAKALAASADAFKEGSDLRMCPRLCTVVEGDDPLQCDRRAEPAFEEALDVLSRSVVMSRFSLRKTGFSRHTHTLAIQPRLPGTDVVSAGPTTTFGVRGDSDFGAVGFHQALWLVKSNPLIDGYRRALHWARKARWEADPQLAILFKWFAVEAVARCSRDDGVASIVAAALGFPPAQNTRDFAPAVRTALAALPNYRSWRTRTLDDVGRLRGWRNDSVHSGFRRWDLPLADLRRFHLLMTLACPRVLGFAEDGLRAGLTSAAELREYLPLLIAGDSHYIDDIKGTVLWRFKNPEPHPF